MITTRSLPHSRRTLPLMLSAVLTAAILITTAPTARAQQNYKTVDAAVDALVATAKSGDQKAALVVLGPGGDDIISSGDKIADDAARARFVASYDAKHEIKMEGDDKATLIIGDNDYPFPIPLMRKDGKWLFDTEAGRREILARRIGHNELDAIQVCLAYVDAQDEYAEKDRTGAGAGVYAARFVSETGTKERALLAECGGRRGKPARRTIRRRVAPRLSPGRRPRAVSRLLLQNTDQTGTPRARRGDRLRRQRQDDRGLRAGGLSGSIPQLRGDDLHG